MKSPHPPCRAPSPIAAQRAKGIYRLQSLHPSAGWEKVADRPDEGFYARVIRLRYVAKS